MANALYLFPSNAIQLEGDSGTTPFTFQVARLGDISDELTVDYTVNSPVLTAVVDGRLPADADDFGGTFPEGTVTFAEGEIFQTITVDVLGDENPEVEQPGIQNADFFNVVLSEPSNDTEIVTEAATGIILNDDPLPSPEVLFGPQAIIAENAGETRAIAAADLDGDSNPDILAVSATDNTITWYENADGDGTTWNANVIATEVANAESVYAADLDGDGDTDVLTEAPSTGGLSWYENQDGSGDFSEAQDLAIDITGATSILVADVNGDSAADILVAGGNTIAWYENLALSPDGEMPGLDPGEMPGLDPGEMPGSDPGEMPGSDPGEMPDADMNGEGQLGSGSDGPTFAPPSILETDGAAFMQAMTTAMADTAGLAAA